MIVATLFLLISSTDNRLASEQKEALRLKELDTTKKECKNNNPKFH